MSKNNSGKFPFSNQAPPPYQGNQQNNSYNPYHQQQQNNPHSQQQHNNASNIIHPFAQNPMAPANPPTHHNTPLNLHGYSTNSQIPQGIRPEIWHWFCAVDEDRNGKITAVELEKSLLNGDWSPFNSETCRLMIGMFDADRNGTIDIHEFTSLWTYIKQWKECFDKFDIDNSGSIDTQELSLAFQTFGYNLSSDFSNLCIRLFDRKDKNCVTLDDFIQICVMLRVLTAKFQEKDTQQTGVIRVYYEDFIKMALDNTIV